MKGGLRGISPFLLQNLIWVPTRLILKFFGSFKIAGRQNINNLPGGVIFAVSHTNELDAIILPAAMSFLSRHLPMFYVSRGKGLYEKSGWRQIFYGGLIFKAWGAYPAIFGIKNYEASLSYHLKILSAGGSICIFPEGKINHDGQLKTAKGGVSYLSWKTGKPVIPVLISGIRQMKVGDFFLRKRKIHITFGEALYPNELFAFCNGQPRIDSSLDNFLGAAQIVMEKIIDIQSRDKREDLCYISARGGDRREKTKQTKKNPIAGQVYGRAGY